MACCAIFVIFNLIAVYELYNYKIFVNSHTIDTTCVLNKCIYRDIFRCSNNAQDVCYETIHIYKLPDTMFTVSKITTTIKNITCENTTKCYYNDQYIDYSLTFDRNKLTESVRYLTFAYFTILVIWTAAYVMNVKNDNIEKDS